SVVSAGGDQKLTGEAALLVETTFGLHQIAGIRKSKCVDVDLIIQEHARSVPSVTPLLTHQHIQCGLSIARNRQARRVGGTAQACHLFQEACPRRGDSTRATGTSPSKRIIMAKGDFFIEQGARRWLFTWTLLAVVDAAA